MPTKYSFEQINNFINDTGEILISNEYINSHSLLDIRCQKCKEIYKVNWCNFKNEHRCPTCATKEKAERATYKYPDVVIWSKNLGFTVLSTEYISAFDKLDFSCDVCGYVFKRAFAHLKHNPRCPMCVKNIGSPSRNNIDYVNKYITDRNNKWIGGEYKSNYSMLQLRCNKKKHIFPMRFNNFQQGQRCPECANDDGRSIGEKDICDHIGTFYKGIIKPNDYTVVFNPSSNYWLELDIYLPEINLAIEFNSYFHIKDEYVIYKDDLKKSVCLEKSILLYIIWHNDWKKDPTKVKKEIKDLIEKLSK
jgi:hypothetical protein